MKHQETRNIQKTEISITLRRKSLCNKTVLLGKQEEILGNNHSHVFLFKQSFENTFQPTKCYLKLG
jgi:hypothetical protein